MGVEVVEVRLDGEEDGDRHQEYRHDGLQHLAWNDRRECRAERAAHDGHQRHRKLFGKLHMAPTGIGDRGRGGAEERLHLVGAEGLERWNTYDQHDGNGDEATAAGNGIDETGKKGRRAEQRKQMESDIGQGGIPGEGLQTALLHLPRQAAMAATTRAGRIRRFP